MFVVLLTASNEPTFDNLWLPNIDQGPYAFMGIILEAIMFAYCFAGLALVCDRYLVPSLETLCVRWNVREDVAGASFMALGSAAPEILISVIGVVKEEADLGVAVSIGSGMIAFSILPALCVLASGQTSLECKRRPVARDALFYLAGLICLTAFFLDGYIVLWESCVLCGLYVAYMCTVFFAPTMRKTYRHWELKQRYMEKIQKAVADGQNAEALEAIKMDYVKAIADKKSFVLEQAEEKARIKAEQHAKLRVASPNGKGRSYGTSDDDVEPGGHTNGHAKTDVIPASDDEHLPDEQEDLIASATHADFGTGTAAGPEPWYLIIWNVCTLPLTLILGTTCIKCDHECKTAKWYPFTMFTALIWVIVFAFVIGAVAGRWNVLSGLPLSLFGIVLVSAGAATPDNIASVTVASRGYGSMAMSNGVGAQITNMLIGLGAPMVVYNIVQLSGAVPEDGTEYGVRLFEHQGLFYASVFQIYNVLSFITTVLIVSLIYKQDKASISQRKGYVCILSYFITVGGYCLVSQLFGDGHADGVNE